MKSLAELQAIKNKMKDRVVLRDGMDGIRVVVGMATCGIAAGARPVLNRLVEETAAHDYNCIVTQTGCIGMCSYEPIVEVYGKDGSHTTYVHMTPDKAARVLEEHVGHGTVVEEYTVDAARRKEGN